MYIKQIKFCYTPENSSWLNVAECELSFLTSQCLGGRRIGELLELRHKIAIWSDKTNARQGGVDRQFRIEDARMKLKRLHHKINTRREISAGRSNEAVNNPSHYGCGTVKTDT